jgi:hypothetical protein
MNLAILDSFSGVFDRVDNLHVARAHTKITGQCFANLFFGWIGITLQKGVTGYDHSRRAVTALKSVVFDEGFLYRAQVTVLCQTFDSRDFTAIRLDREMETGFNNFAVEEHGAGAALADDAADVSASETNILAEEMGQEQAGFDVFFVQALVNRNANRLFHKSK